jgi:hypothetical protein
MPAQWCAPGAAENCPGGIIFGRQKQFNGMERISPKRAESLFVPLPEQTHLMRSDGLKITSANSRRFADASTGVVQEKQQGVVALSGAGFAIRLFEQKPHVMRLKVTRRARGAALCRQSEDTGILVGSRRVLPQGVSEETAQGNPTTVARDNPVVTVLLKVLEKCGDAVRLQIVEPQAVNGGGATVGQKLQEEFKRVAVGRDRVSAGSAHRLQVVAEEGLDQGEEWAARLHEGEGAK